MQLNSNSNRSKKILSVIAATVAISASLAMSNSALAAMSAGICEANYKDCLEDFWTWDSTCRADRVACYKSLP